MGGLGRVMGGLGAVLGGLGALIEGSVAQLGADMAEKSNKSVNKSRFPFHPPPLGEEKRRKETAKGSPKGRQMEPKWE